MQLYEQTVMMAPQAFGLVFLLCGFITVLEPTFEANATPFNDCRTCDGVSQAECPENQPGRGSDIAMDVFDEKESKRCGLEEYDLLNEICCESTVLAKPGPMAECCGKEAIDKETQLCCGPNDNKTILTMKSRYHRCCLHNQYNLKTECCCVKEKTEVQPRSNPVGCCVNNPEPTAERRANPATEAKCGEKVYDEEKQLCCGPSDDKKILNKTSKDNRCCGQNQYNKETQCCCPTTLQIQSRLQNADCCGVQLKMNNVSLPKCPETSSSICGSVYYNPKERRCCQRKHTEPRRCCPSGQCDAEPSVYDPNTEICCDGCLSVLKPWMDQCCGNTAYGLAQRGVLCCNNTLYEHREDEEECSESGHPYNPTNGTMCASRFYEFPGKHCCGSKIFWPKNQICCNGHRHTKRGTTLCCGINAYRISDPSKKCCAGILYNMTRKQRDGVQCCGSFLKNSEEICCTSEKKEKLYTAKTGFLCCGNQYYNTSLWSCCAGRLSPVQPSQNNITGSTLQSVINLKKSKLCKKIFIGAVGSVSLQSIVFSSVLEIHGRSGTVNLLASPYILKTHEHCKFPKLTPGKTYYFSRNDVFTDFNHDSVLQSLHFILSKCSK